MVTAVSAVKRRRDKPQKEADLSIDPARQPSKPAAHLRLFTPGAEQAPLRATPTLTPQMTLVDFFEAFYLPICLVAAGADPLTIKVYREALAHWTRITGNPPLAEINDFVAATFVTDLAKVRRSKRSNKPIAVPTVIKHANHVQFVLDMAGPRTQHKRLRQAQRLLDEVPFLPKPTADDELKSGNFTLEEIERLLDACRDMTVPCVAGIPPVVWWRTVIALAYNTGLRIGSLMHFRLSYVETNEFGRWINPPAKAGAKKRRSRPVYLNAAAQQALDVYEQFRRTPTPTFFGFPGWPASQGVLQKYRRKLLALAGIPKSRRFGFHGLRRACSHEMHRIDPRADQLQLGHTNERTTAKHYTSAQVVTLASERMPQPKRPDADGQLRLPGF